LASGSDDQIIREGLGRMVPDDSGGGKQSSDTKYHLVSVRENWSDKCLSEQLLLRQAGTMLSAAVQCYLISFLPHPILHMRKKNNPEAYIEHSASK
jgi:hypothetical protein